MALVPRFLLLFSSYSIISTTVVLGGWEPHKDRKPGKITLMRGLRRLIDMLATQAVLSRYASEHQGLPPNITAFLHGWYPPNEL